MTMRTRFFFAGLFLVAGVSMLTLREARAQAAGEAVEPLQVILPLAEQSSDGEGCKATSELTDPNARAYGEHLEGRFNTRVTLCLASDRDVVVELAGAPGASLVWADQATAMALPGQWRASMALRDGAGLGRTPFVLFALKSEPRGLIDTAAIQRVGLLDQPPANLHLESARAILADYGLIAGAGGQTFPSMSELFAALEAGDIDAAIVDATMWGAECALLDADSTVCDGYDVLMYDRPRATHAFMVPTDMSVERRYRLTGVHIALHIERPDLFAWLSQGEGSEFEPAEASAMAPKSPETAIAF